MISSLKVISISELRCLLLHNRSKVFQRAQHRYVFGHLWSLDSSWKGQSGRHGEKDAGRTFCTSCNKDPLLISGLPGSLVFFWAKNRRKGVTKKRASDRTVERMGPKFLKFHLMRLLPSDKITTLSPSSNPKLPVARPQRHRFCHHRCHH